MPLFTSANARQMWAKGIQARRDNSARRRNIERNVEALSAKVRELSAQSTEVALARLARVRKQLDLVDERITEELSHDGTSIGPDGQLQPCDGQLVNWLCAAQERLAEQERILAGRPLPGSLRPSSKPARSPTTTQADFSDPSPPPPPAV